MVVIHVGFFGIVGRATEIFISCQNISLENDTSFLFAVNMQIR